MNNQYGFYGNSQGNFNSFNSFNNRNLSNIIMVTSLEEALYRTTERGSDMLYVHQTEPVFYRVKVENDGRKTWSEYPYNVPSANDTRPVTKSEFDALLEKVSALEKKLCTEATNEQSV